MMSSGRRSLTDWGIKDASKASWSSDSGVRVVVVVGMLGKDVVRITSRVVALARLEVLCSDDWKSQM